MWFFSKKKRAKSIEDLTDFLNMADEALILAYQTKQLDMFIPYASNKVLCYVTERINSGERILFGTKNYRTSSWTILSDNGNCISVKKELRHRHVRLNKNIYVAIGDDLDEFWKVSRLGDKYIVSEIEEAS